MEVNLECYRANGWWLSIARWVKDVYAKGAQTAACLQPDSKRWYQPKVYRRGRSEKERLICVYVGYCDIKDHE